MVGREVGGHGARGVGKVLAGEAGEASGGFIADSCADQANGEKVGIFGNSHWSSRGMLIIRVKCCSRWESGRGAVRALKKYKKKRKTSNPRIPTPGPEADSFVQASFPESHACTVGAEEEVGNEYSNQAEGEDGEQSSHKPTNGPRPREAGDAGA